VEDAAAMADTELWLIDLQQSAPALAELERDAPRLTAQDLRRVRTLLDARARADRLAIYTALRLLLERMVGADIARAPFVFGPGGKPRLAAGSAAFSLSHVEGYALIGLTRSGEIGVDLERERTVRISPPRRQALVAAARGLSSRPLMGATPEARFLQAWSRLEAFAKATGQGLSRTLTDLGVRGSRTRPPDDLQALARRRAREAGFRVHDIELVPGLFAATAFTKSRCPAPRPLPDHRAGLGALLQPQPRLGPHRG
jgi:4'-phosphopantetheinyl transferase